MNDAKASLSYDLSASKGEPRMLPWSKVFVKGRQLKTTPAGVLLWWVSIE